MSEQTTLNPDLAVPSAPEVVERLMKLYATTIFMNERCQLDWSVAIGKAHSLIQAQRMEIAELRAALEEIAEQRLADSMSPQEYADANFEEGYDCCVRRARLALTPKPQHGDK